ncbi:MAG: isoleucine--tRNA ligase, partial [Anaerolineae bacterium]
SFPGQFRNWFYSLLAMATVVDGTPPFKELFGYALLFAEDGRQMHKSWGNAIEFNEAADKMGVDVMRWLYCAHKPENNLLFGYGRADDVRRRFLIPLWNIYSFFTTYASLDDWQPGALEDPARPAETTPHSDNLLDRWILARLNQTIRDVSDALKSTDPFRATIAAEAFVDDLSNWYLRRSRRRYWKSDADDTDKQAAYATLYHVLVRLARLLAPFMPFVTEVMYQNLVRGVYPEALESVHHTLWPQADESVIDQALMDEMALARRIASLGLSARANANIKVRQPLSRVLVDVGSRARSLSEELTAIVVDELNVKHLEFVEDAGALVSYRILPNNKLLGPKFGKDFPAVRKALAALPPAEVAAKVAAGETVTLEVNGQTVELSGEEILVQTEAAAG